MPPVYVGETQENCDFSKWLEPPPPTPSQWRTRGDGGLRGQSWEGPRGSGKGGCSSADPSPRPGRQSREEFPGTRHPLRVQGRGAPRKRKCLWQKRDFHSVVRASPVFCFLKIISLEESSGRRGIFGGGHTPLPFTFLGFCLAGCEN